MTFITTTDQREALDSTPGTRGLRPAIRAAIVIMLILVGGATGWIVGASRSMSYVSTASIVINPLPGNPLFDESLAELETLQTEAQRTRSDAVLSAVVDQLDGAVSSTVLQRRVSVAVAPRSEVIEVSYRGGSAEASATVAEVLAQATLQERERRAADLVADQIDQLRRAITTSQRALSGASSRADEERLARRLVLLNSQVRDLKDQSLTPGAVIGVTTGQVSSKAVKAVFALAGAVSGAIAGLWLLFWVRRRSRGARS